MFWINNELPIKAKIQKGAVIFLFLLIKVFHVYLCKVHFLTDYEIQCLNLCNVKFCRKGLVTVLLGFTLLWNILNGHNKSQILTYLNAYNLAMLYPDQLKEIHNQIVGQWLWLSWYERSLPIPEIHGSNPVIGKIYIKHLFTSLLSTALKRRK